MLLPVKRLATSRAALLPASLALLAAWAAVSAGAPQRTATAEEPEPPNVVVVMTDDQDVGSLAVMENVQSKLVARGTTFENFFATFPLCCPSRATFLTGQYAHNHGVLDNVPPDGGYAGFSHPETALPVALQAAGYHTGLIGKYLNGYQVEDPVPPGWEFWRGADSPPYPSYHYTLSRNGTAVRYRGPGDYRTDVYAELATNYIERAHAADRPFFLTVSLGVPHTKDGGGLVPPEPGPAYDGRFDGEPLPMPPSFNERNVSDKPAFVRNRPRLTQEDVARLSELHRARLASLLPVDALVRRVVRALQESGELANTYVIFTSDNGHLLGEHRLEGKTWLYEESVEVPMIIRGPGIPAGAARRQLTGNVDLAPTILDVADADPLRPVDGRSLLPLAGEPDTAWRKEILLENNDSTAIRTRRHMYVEHLTGEKELYDLQADPFQRQSLHDDVAYDAVEAALEARLRTLRECVGTTCR
jgi:N-acetylglucosamine-6-sulfatase